MSLTKTEQAELDALRAAAKAKSDERDEVWARIQRDKATLDRLNAEFADVADRIRPFAVRLQPELYGTGTRMPLLDDIGSARIKRA